MLEGLDATSSLVAATALGGAIVFGAMKLFSGISSQATSSSKKKKKRTKAKKKKPKAGKDTKEEPKKKAPVTPVDKEVKFQTPEDVPPPAAEVAAPEPAKKKKKRKKKKAQKVVEAAPEEVDSDDSDDFLAIKNETKSSKPAKKAAVEEVPVVPVKLSQTEIDDGWKTVPVKAKPKAAENPVVSASTDDEEKKEVKKRVTVDIGDFVNVILGEGGGTIQGIETISGARVNLNREQKNCLVTGTEIEVDIAVQMITSIISNQDKVEVLVTSKLDKAIISKGDTKQKIKTLSGAKLDYHFGENRDAPLRLVISGEKSEVALAKQLIDGYLAGKTPDGSDGIKRIKVSSFQGRMIIGQKGEMVNYLQKNSGANINIEFVDDQAVISVIGSSEQIASGIDAIRVFLEKHSKSLDIPLDPDARGVLLKLNDLRKSNANLRVEVTPDRSSIILTGSDEDVAEGKASVLEWIERELGPPPIKEGQVMEKIDMGSAAGRVIGKNRSTINQLVKKAKGAEVDLKRGTLCYVFGTQEGVTKLAGDIKEIIAKHEEVVAKSQQEEKELKEANWFELGSESSLEEDVSGDFAPESDWGGFTLAQKQGW